MILKRYELSIGKGFDTLEQIYEYLDDVKQEIQMEAAKDGITENVITEGMAGDGWTLELWDNDETIQ